MTRLADNFANTCRFQGEVTASGIGQTNGLPSPIVGSCFNLIEEAPMATIHKEVFIDDLADKVWAAIADVGAHAAQGPQAA